MDSFSNVPIDFDSIPQAEEIAFNPIEKKYLGISLISTTLLYLLFAVLAAGIFYAVASKNPIAKGYLNYVLGIVAVFWLIAMVLALFGFKWKGYIIREKDIIYRTGLIIRKRVHIPFNRVQHCEVAQDAIERIINLSKLKIYTAGGSRSDLSIPGLKQEDALKMKQFILKKSIDENPVEATSIIDDESE